MTRDPLSGVMSPNLIKITRQVEVMEWRRHTRREDDREQVYYELEWVSSGGVSEGVYLNPPENWFIESDVIYNTRVFLGGYNIDKTTAEMCEKCIPFSPTMENANSIMMNTGRRNVSPSLSGEYIYFTPGGGGGSSF